MRGALARPSRRATARLSLTSTSVGTLDLEPVGQLRAVVDVDDRDAEAAAPCGRCGRAGSPSCAPGRSAGGEEHEQRRGSAVIVSFVSVPLLKPQRSSPADGCTQVPPLHWPRWATGTRSASRSASASRSGSSSPGCSRGRRRAGSRRSRSASRRGALGGSWSRTGRRLAGGVVGGFLGGFGAAIVVAGALRRGGTRGGIALSCGAAAGRPRSRSCRSSATSRRSSLPAFGLRLRSREPERHAGLRTLARD